MHKRALLCVMLLLLLLPLCALAEGLGFTVVPDILLPGKTERISFTAPSEGRATVTLQDQAGNETAVIRADMAAAAGVNNLTWDGLDENGQAVSPGIYLLSVSMNGEEALQSLEIGQESPQIVSVSAPASVSPGEVWSVTVETNMPGTFVMRIQLADGAWHNCLEEAVPQGESLHYWNGSVEGAGIANGDYAVQLRLVDADGNESTAQQIYLSVTAPVTPSPVPTATPAPTPRIVIPSAVTTQQEETSYWTLPVGVMDEAAIWNVMMQPMTVIDGNQKEVYRLRKTPDNSSARDNVVGEITYASQGVHILERGEEWTLVEAYNSSYGPDCKSRPGYGVTDDLIRGYVKTSLLKTIEPRTEYGLLIDKMEQKMYIFENGKCTGSLLVSTGLNNATQSWNETPSGEFVMISRMGGFAAGNLWCSYGMRINGGCAIHEVPYIGNADTPSDRRDYSSTIKLLGKKASHGCIRVQKAANEAGQNIKWLWDNIKVNTKVLIWDDTGRFLPYPDDDMPVYYNPNGGKNFHTDQYCSAVKDRYLPLTAITYAQLHDEFDGLTPCSHCANLLMKKDEIDAINRENGY